MALDLHACRLQKFACLHGCMDLSIAPPNPPHHSEHESRCLLSEARSVKEGREPPDRPFPSFLLVFDDRWIWQNLSLAVQLVAVYASCPVPDDHAQAQRERAADESHRPGLRGAPPSPGPHCAQHAKGETSKREMIAVPSHRIRDKERPQPPIPRRGSWPSICSDQNSRDSSPNPSIGPQTSLDQEKFGLRLKQHGIGWRELRIKPASRHVSTVRFKRGPHFFAMHTRFIN